jgi:hypothetical protein
LQLRKNPSCNPTCNRDKPDNRQLQHHFQLDP